MFLPSFLKKKKKKRPLQASCGHKGVLDGKAADSIIISTGPQVQRERGIRPGHE